MTSSSKKILDIKSPKMKPDQKFDIDYEKVGMFDKKEKKSQMSSQKVLRNFFTHLICNHFSSQENSAVYSKKKFTKRRINFPKTNESYHMIYMMKGIKWQIWMKLIK